MIEASGVNDVVLHANDVERSKKSYTDILVMTVFREDEGQIFCDFDEHRLQLMARA
jgi:catechol-2,3-dioxygenase